MLTRLVPQPQGAPPPGQLEGGPPGAAEFVICDCTIEEQFRDTKGSRFGVRLEWTPFRPPAYLARFTLLLGGTLLLWTAVGQAVAHVRPQVRLPCKRKGPRLSLLRVGIQFVTQLAPLISMGIRFIRTYLPPPQVRRFPWLQALEDIS